MIDYLKEAQEIHDDYKNRSRRFPTPFNDAVIAFLWLIARLMIERHDRETPSVVPAKVARKAGR